MKRITHRGVAAFGLTLLALAIAGCGSGGGGGNTSSSTGTNGSTGTSSNGTSLLANYVIPDAIAADVVTNYSGPAFTTNNSAVQARCANTSVVSSTVIVTPNTLVFSAGASLKAQELAADLAEQAIASVRSYFNQPSSTVGFDGINKVQICVDPMLGASGSGNTSITGQTGLNVSQIMSADSPNFDARYANAPTYATPVGTSYFDLFRHEMTHAYNYAQVEPFVGLEPWYLEGTASIVSQLLVPSKATILGFVNSTDLLSPTNDDSNLTVLPAYASIIDYLTSSAPGGLNNGQASLQTLLTTFKANAIAVCGQPIQSGVTPAAPQTLGMPAGTYNACAGANGTIDPRLETAFDQAFNSTFKDTNGAPLLLHTNDGSNSLEATLYQRLNGFL